MSNQTHYEVHVQQGGRWSIHAQFESNEKEEAINEGRSVTGQSGINAVKVVREVFDTVEGTHRDYVIFKSSDLETSEKWEQAKAHASTSQELTEAPSDTSWLEGEQGDEFGGVMQNGQWESPPKKEKRKKKKKKKKKKSKRRSNLTSIAVRLLVIILVSVSLAGLITVVSSNLLHGTTLLGSRIEGNLEQNILFLIFIATFLLSASSLFANQIRNMKFERAEVPDTSVSKEPPSPKSVAEEKRLAAQQEAAANEARIAQEEQAARQELEDAMQGIEEFKLEDDQQLIEEEAIDERLKSAINEAPDNEEEIPFSPGVDEPTEVSSPHVETQKSFMSSFLSETLAGAKADPKKLDNFNKFGINLFLAGACETLSEARQLDEQSRAQVLADGVREMGFKKSHATAFSTKYEDYLLQDARYMQMFQAGRNAMNTYFDNEAGAGRHMERALEDWNRPKQQAEQAGPITVLFTDIVDSTALTQALGDAGAQQLVRAHNTIVRNALTDCNGKEVKHTGDGIMASFTRVTDSVDAAIQMQRETTQHNQNYPDLPLHLKIGLNAGEPIAEDNDLFGTVVQMAARIVDKAKADEIFVSDIVRGICVGKAYTFINRGGFSMKGFDEDPTLYEVVWRDDDQAAAE